MARLLYSLALHGLLPYVGLRLLWRARRQPAYLQHVGERFGLYPSPPAPLPRGERGVIWLHAVSVGETRAAQPLVTALRAAYPGQRILLTHMTPTGRDTSEVLFGEGVERAYLPYDYPWAVRRFLRHFRPRLGVFMETEIWPNLIAACGAAGVPLLLLNARLSARSARGYARFRRLTRPALAGFRAIAAQTQDDAARLRQLGAAHVSVTGSMKFDVLPPAAQLAAGRALRRRFGSRPVLLAASTRDGEEALLLDAFARARLPEALLVLVPRHPQRFDEVAALARTRGLRLARRSSDEDIAPDSRVVLGDSMGEMFAYYAACDVAFIGGSLLPYGSQNLIEACAVGVPVLVGPSTYNFAEAADKAVAAGAALRVADADEVMRRAGELLADEAARRRMGEAGKAFTAQHRGATARALGLVEEILGRPEEATAPAAR
jgi:3-deoxy-D-manno-octulosonic-acid transferase